MEKKYVYVSALVAIVSLLNCSGKDEKAKIVVDSLERVTTRDSIHYATTLAESKRVPFLGDPEEFTRELDRLYNNLSQMNYLCDVYFANFCSENVSFSEFEDYAKVVWDSLCSEELSLTKSYLFKNGSLFSVKSVDNFNNRTVILYLKNDILTESKLDLNGQLLYNTTVLEGGSLNEYYPEVNTVLAKFSGKTEYDRSYLSSNDDVLKEAIADSAKVISLNLDWQSLSSVPQDVFKLKKLRELSLVHNELTQLPPEISNLSNLEDLKLRYNKLITLPAALGTLSKLVTLNLAGNKLNDSYDTFLPSGLSQLKYLNLNSNDLIGIPFEVSKLENLQTLNLSENLLEIFPEGVLKLSNLTYFSLYGNPITAIPDEINKLQKLETLDLSTTNLTTFPSAVLRLRNLKRLDLSYTSITEIPPTIAELTKLKLLSLAGTNISVNEQKKLRDILSKINCVVGF